MKKASISLSINFIVILIISMVVMGFGFSMLKDIIFKSNDTLSGAKDDLINSLNKIMSNTNEPVYIFPESIEVERGKHAFFAVGANNVRDSPDTFTFTVTYKFAQDDDGSNIALSDPQFSIICSNVDASNNFYLTNKEGSDTINQREKATAVVGISIDDTAEPYTYVYEIDVSDSNGQYGDPQLLYVRVI